MLSVGGAQYTGGVDENHCRECRKAISALPRAFCDSACYGRWQRGKTFREQGKPELPRRSCSVAGCGTVHFGKGYCRKHYLSLYYQEPPRPVRPGKPRKPRSAPRSLNCAQCGGAFVALYDSARYCSTQCAGMARRKPFILKKGYRKVLILSHPRADAKGYVFEHIVIAEATIGRALQPKEEVHHLDMNRQNNAPANLKVCANHAEHMEFHRTPSCSIEK